MKIDPTRPTLPPSTAKHTATAGTGFTPHTAQAAGAPSVKAATASLAADAVLALQGVEDPMARRARQVRRGHDSLNALERLRLGLLEGAAPVQVRASLERLLRGRDDTDDPTLDALMQDIDVRVAVELAKLER
jgi:hypothetical protein